MSKINVLEFSNQWSMGGTEKSAQLFIKYLDKEKFNVYAAGWRGGPREEIIKGLAKEVLITEDQDQMIEWIKSKRIDIVHFHRAGNEENILIDTFTRAGVKCLVEHNIFAQVDPSNDNDLIDKHIFVSEIQKQFYIERSGTKELDKLAALYNPVETEDFDKKSDYNAPVFGRHSRDDMNKWHIINIQILPWVKAMVPNAKFHVIGLPAPYRDAIKRMGCEDMVVEFPMTPDQKEISKFLQGLTVYTHGSSIGESFGIGIAEAMATGLPVVTHAGGDGAQAELVLDKETGMVTSPEDVKAYADAVIGYLMYPNVAKAHGKKGTERANLFNAKEITKRLEEIFLEIYNKKHL